jgi:hypothetical protein
MNKSGISTYPAPAKTDPGLTGYRQVLYWRITESARRILIMQFVALFLLLPWGILFFWLAVRLGKMSFNIHITSFSSILVALVAVLLTMVLHELAHGVVMRLFGAHPIYGILWSAGAFYATSPGYAFTRRQYLIVATAPLILLSLLAVLLMIFTAGSPLVWVWMVCAIYNAAGAAGDLWIVTVVLRYPAEAMVMDEKDGVRIFLPVRQSEREAGLQ